MFLDFGQRDPVFLSLRDYRRGLDGETKMAGAAPAEQILFPTNTRRDNHGTVEYLKILTSFTHDDFCQAVESNNGGFKKARRWQPAQPAGGFF
jgi:hypothetical protein